MADGKYEEGSAMHPGLGGRVGDGVSEIVTSHD